MLDSDSDGKIHAREVKAYVRANMEVMKRLLRTAGGSTGISVAKMKLLTTQVQKEAFSKFAQLRERDSDGVTAIALLDASTSGTNPFEKLLLDAFKRGLEYANSPNHDGNEF